MLTKCTNPAAPSYHLDTLLLSFLESVGIDLPCDLLGGFAAGAMVMALIPIALALLATIRVVRKIA